MVADVIWSFGPMVVVVVVGLDSSFYHLLMESMITLVVLQNMINMIL